MGDLLDRQIIQGFGRAVAGKAPVGGAEEGAKIWLIHIDNGNEAYVGRKAGVLHLRDCACGVGRY